MIVYKEVSETSQLFRQDERSLVRDAVRKLVANRLAMVSLFVIVFVFFIGIFGPLLAPQDYLEQDLRAYNQGPSREHLLGTDELGRDMLSRLLWGGRTAIMVAVVSTSISYLIGILFGTLAAYRGGLTDAVFVRTVDLFDSFPHILVAMLLASTMRPWVLRLARSLEETQGISLLADNTVYIDYLVVFGALSMIGWAGIGRLIRGQVLTLRATDFVLAARCVGARERWIILRHLVPNAIGPVIVALSSSFGGAMMYESSLSFIGIGIQPPGASWGNMIVLSMGQWRYYPHLVLMPGILLMLAIIAFNFFGDGLNDALNPRALAPVRR